MANLPDNTPALLRAAGLKVVELDGWRHRGRPASTGGFAPVGVLCHHTASSADGRAGTNILVNGRSDLPGPLAHFGLSRDGTVYVVAAGRANHAGKARSSGSVAAGDGNRLYIGIEAMNRGTGEKWPKAQYDAYVKLCAVLCLKVTGNSHNTVRAHKESSVTGKIDPFGPTPYEGSFDMGKFRARVKAEMDRQRGGSKPAPKPKTSHTRYATRVTGVYDKIGGRELRDLKVGESFKVIDGSGSGKGGWVQTTHGNWVNGNHTSKSKPKPAPTPARTTLKVMSWNVENKGAADAKADGAEVRALLAAHKPDVVCLQEAYRIDLAGIPGYREVYHAAKGYPVTSENRAQAILVRDGVTVKAKKPLQMALEWIGPKVGAKKAPRVHRYVDVVKGGKAASVATFHVPFGAAPVEETRKAIVAFVKKDGARIAVGDLNSLGKDTVAKVGKPAGATVDGGGIDKAIFRGCKKVKGTNLGKRGRSDHDVKIWEFEI